MLQKDFLLHWDLLCYSGQERHSQYITPPHISPWLLAGLFNLGSGIGLTGY